MNSSCVDGSDPLNNVPYHLLMQMYVLHNSLLEWLVKKADFVEWHNHSRKVWDYVGRKDNGDG